MVRKKRMSYLTACTISFIVTLFILFLVDAQPWIFSKYSSYKTSRVVFEEQCRDIQEILQPYGIDFSSYVEFKEDELGCHYFAEIPVANDCRMIITAFTYDGYFDMIIPGGSVCLESSQCLLAQETVLDISQYPEVYEIVSYYLGKRTESKDVLEATHEVYQKTLNEIDFVNSKKDHFYFSNSKRIKGIFLELADITVRFDYLDESNSYQSSIHYLYDIRC